MKIKRNFGILLLVGAFVFAAAGNAARGLSGESGILGILGAKQVLDVLAPTFISSIAQFCENHLHPLFWDPILVTLLAFPGWLLIGLPGAILVWKFRQIPVGGEATDEELNYNTYDDVLAAAEEADFENPAEPSKYGILQEYDPLAPPDDQVKYSNFVGQPEGASDLADFRNEIIDMPRDIQTGSGEDNIQRVAPKDAQNLAPPISKTLPSAENESETTPNNQLNK